MFPLWLPPPVHLPAIHEAPARVVGGEPVALGEAPWVAALLLGDTPRCTGVLIAPEWVLTAGHCSFSASQVLLGATDLAGTAEQLGEAYGIVQITPYPDFSTTLDLALIQLDRPATQPPLALLQQCDSAVDGMPAWVYGFGATDPQGVLFDDLLRSASLTVDVAACRDPSRGCAPLAFPSGELIASAPGADSCSGDSGGPLIIDEQGAPQLLGIVSRGALPASTACGDGGIYVRPDAAYGWMRDTTGLALAGAQCENSPPSIGATQLTVPRGATASVPLDVADPDGDAISLRISSVLPGYTAVLVGETLAVTASLHAPSPASVTVFANDGRGGLTEQTLTLRLAPQPTSPSAGCATGSAPAPGFFAHLLLALALLRRRCGR